MSGKVKTVTAPKFDRELVFTFRYPNVKCVSVNEPDREYTGDISEAVKDITREICIDKTFVDFKGTGFRKTFMSEDGWRDLCDLVRKTNYGKKATKAQNDSLYESFKAMIVCYVEDCFSDLGWDTSRMAFEVADDKFIVEYRNDTWDEWKKYPGKWQTWRCNN